MLWAEGDHKPHQSVLIEWKADLGTKVRRGREIAMATILEGGEFYADDWVRADALGKNKEMNL